MGPIPPHSTLVFDVELLSVGGAGSGQSVTMWNTPVAAVLLIALTALVAYGLHETLTTHDFVGHFFGN